MLRHKDAAGLLVWALLVATGALAADPSDLGKSLTPFGAIKAGNEAGTIPPWEGGITAPPAGYEPGQHYVDPYAGEQPLFTITADNFDKYADKLMPGTVAKLKAYPAFKVIVYPTHRSFSAPRYIYDAAIENAKTARMGPDGESPVGNVATVPFPLAKTGTEAMLNYLLRWQGTAVRARLLTTPVSESGTFVEQVVNLAINLPDAKPGEHTAIGAVLSAETVSPARMEGDKVLVTEFIDHLRQPRLEWTDNLGQRRIRRAPQIEYDYPIGAYDGLVTADDLAMFNGALNRFDWKLLGVKEIYIPYNDYALQEPNYRYSDLIKPLCLNADIERWELHRVYLVEGDLKFDQKHVYSKRIYAIDEDSWSIILADLYLRDGELWRTHTNYTINYDDVPILTTDAMEYDDLLARRYAVLGLFNQEPVPTFDRTDLDIPYFNPSGMGHGH